MPKKSKTRKFKVGKKTRTFHLTSIFNKKPDAQAIAKSHRRKGKRARVVPVAGGHGVYVNPK